jgi:hypothetical protein
VKLAKEAFNIPSLPKFYFIFNNKLLMWILKNKIIIGHPNAEPTKKKTHA